MNIQQHRTELEQRKGKRNQLQNQVDKSEQKIKSLERQEKDLQQAQLILQSVAKATQDELCFHISELVTLALEAVFPDPYKFVLEFTLRRGKSEADLYFLKGKERVHPTSASGGGAIDIATFALRVSLWSLKQPRSRNVLILDEPFRFLSENLQPKASQMLKEISEKLKLQMIIVTHETELLESADKIFKVTMKKGVSKVEVSDE